MDPLVPAISSSPGVGFRVGKGAPEKNRGFCDLCLSFSPSQPTCLGTLYLLTDPISHVSLWIFVTSSSAFSLSPPPSPPCLRLALSLLFHALLSNLAGPSLRPVLSLSDHFSDFPFPRGPPLLHLSLQQSNDEEKKERKGTIWFSSIRVTKPWWPCIVAVGPARLPAAASRLGSQPGSACSGDILQKHGKHGDTAGPHQGQGVFPSGIVYYGLTVCIPTKFICSHPNPQCLEVGPLGGNRV